MSQTDKAAELICTALTLLKTAKDILRSTRNDQHVPLAVHMAALEEIHDILTDLECTPEISEGR